MSTPPDDIAAENARLKVLTAGLEARVAALTRAADELRAEADDLRHQLRAAKRPKILHDDAASSFERPYDGR